MNAGIRITINIVINNNMKCMMHILIISNTIMCINIKLYTHTKPITTATIHPGVQRALHPEDVLHVPDHGILLPTPAARVVAIHEDNTAARPSQSM